MVNESLTLPSSQTQSGLRDIISILYRRLASLTLFPSYDRVGHGLGMEPPAPAAALPQHAGGGVGAALLRAGARAARAARAGARPAPPPRRARARACRREGALEQARACIALQGQLRLISYESYTLKSFSDEASFFF